MRAPLLQSDDSRFLHSSYSLSFFLIFTFLFTISFVCRSLQDGEVSVGSPPNWMPLVQTYFALEGLVITMQDGFPYAGQEVPTAKDELCDYDPPSCSDICRRRALKEPESNFPKFCQKAPQVDSSTACWEISKLRCWSRLGGNLVWDGQQEWMLKRHYMGITEPLDDAASSSGPGRPYMRWMFLQSETNGMIALLFGVGNVRALTEIRGQLTQLTDLNQVADDMAADESRSLLIGGQSEGAGWAVCFHDLLHDKGIKNENFVIGTAPLMASRDLLSPPRANFLFFMVASTLPEPYQGQLADVATMIHSRAPKYGITFPAFGYTCDEHATKCLEFRAPLDLMGSLGRGMLMRKAPRFMKAISDIHTFKNYKACFYICLEKFISTEGFNFQVNTPSYCPDADPPPQAALVDDDPD